MNDLFIEAQLKEGQRYMIFSGSDLKTFVQQAQLPNGCKLADEIKPEDNWVEFQVLDERCGIVYILLRGLEIVGNQEKPVWLMVRTTVIEAVENTASGGRDVLIITSAIFKRTMHRQEKGGKLEDPYTRTPFKFPKAQLS